MSEQQDEPSEHEGDGAAESDGGADRDPTEPGEPVTEELPGPGDGEPDAGS